jgi:uncharacterized membrane protein
MQCPLCSVSIPPETMVCPGCGTDCTVLFTVQSLQRDLQRARDQSASVGAQLDQLQGHLDAFATHVQTALMQTHPGPPLTATPASEAAAVPSDPPPAPPEFPPEAPPQETAPRPVLTEGAELQFGQKWLLLAGVAITVLGIGFFLKYAFDQNWVRPAGRIILGYLAAVAFFGVGDFFRRRSGAAAFGLYLIGGGVATLYLVTYAAFQLYELLSQTVAFGLMVLVTILACLLALVYDTQWLAVLGLIGGFLTPLILSTGQSAQVVLMTYMVLLNGGILSIAAWKRWQILNTLGFLCTWLLFTGWFVDSYTVATFWRTLVFLHLFFLIYAFVPFLYYFVHASGAHLTGSLLASLNTLVTFAYAYGMVRTYASLPAVSLVALAYASLFFGMASYLYRRHPENLEPFILLLAKGLLFLIIAVPMLFSGHWITLFWSVQVGVILWAGLRLHNRWLCYGALVLLLLALGKFVFYDYGEVFAFRLETLAYARDFADLLLERWMTMAFVLGALLYSAHMLRTAEPVLEPWQPHVTTWLYGTFAVLLFVVLTFEVSAYFYARASQARFAAISILWTLYSIALMLLGFRYQQARLRLVSLGLFGITILKVFLADMARVSTPFRIVSFVVLGLMLIGASYLYYRYRGHLLRTPSAEEQL